MVSLIVLSLLGAGLAFSFFSEVVCPVVAIIGFMGLIAYSFLAFSYVGAEYKAGIINREYGTSYTQEEVFYASSVIDTIRDLNRSRMEINGDLITGK